MCRYVESPGCLSYARTRRKYDKVGFLESSEDLVNVSETSLNTLDLTALSLKLLDLLDILQNDIIDICVSCLLCLLSYLKDPLLCAVKNIIRRKLA